MGNTEAQPLKMDTNIRAGEERKLVEGYLHQHPYILLEGDEKAEAILKEKLPHVRYTFMFM